MAVKIVINPNLPKDKHITRDINEIQVPDLWHLAMWLKNTDKQRKPQDALTEAWLKEMSVYVLETWHLTHALKQSIALGLIENEKQSGGM